MGGGAREGGGGEGGGWDQAAAKGLGLVYREEQLPAARHTRSPHMCFGCPRHAYLRPHSHTYVLVKPG